jgi:hypothetical protein
MNRIGIKIDLDTGDLVSSAGRARQSIAGLTDEMKKAQKEGRWEDYTKISFEKDRLQGKTSGFERDIKTLANDPRFQTQTSTGGTVLKIDSEYVNAIKNQTDAIKKLTDEYQGAIRSGDVGRIHELTPQIDRQQFELQKTIRDIINTGGDFSKGQVVKNVPISDGLPKENAWRELKGISGAITQEHDVGNWGQVSRLGNNKDALQGIMGEYDRDSKLEAKIKADPEFASQLKEIRDALKGTIAAIDEAAANGEYEKAEQLTGQAKQLQGISHKTVQEAAAPPDSKLARDAALASFLNVQTAQQIVGAVTSGINTYVAHLDRSSIVNAMGGGDVMGAQIDELHRSAAEKSALWGSVGRIGGGILGGIIGSFIVPGLGTAAGAALGSTLLGAGGDLVGTLGDEKKANEMATSEAYAKLWERQAPDAMGLTAMFGKYGGTDAENSNAIRRMFENAANTATGYGYSPEEGMEQIKQAAYQGLDERQALDASRDVFAFERGTGADRGALAEFRNRTERFGGVSNGLNTAWQGNQASGMAPAQFNEFLRSMQRTFEDGISKGFVRGADEIAGNLSFLANLNGGSELWKGEQGANRLSQMNSSVEQTTNLASTTDILAYRGAQNVLGEYTADDLNWKKLLDVDNDGSEDIIRGQGSSEYINAMMVLERGLTPQLFNEQMKMFNTAEKGDYASMIERMRQAYGLNYTQSAQLYKGWEQNKNTPGYFDSEAFAQELEKYSEKPPENNSTESTMLSYVNDIKKYTYEIGQWHLDQKMPGITDALRKVWEEAKKYGNTNDPGPGQPANPFPPKEPDWKSIDTSNMSHAESVETWQREYDDAINSGDRERITNAERKLREAKGPRVVPDPQDTRNPSGLQAVVDQANSVEREMRTRDMQEDVIRGTKDATKYLFSEGIFGFGKENSQMVSINKTVENAAKSGDPTQFDAAKEFSDIISRYGKENGFFDNKKYDDNNTFNSLAEFSGDITKMLGALRSLIERIDGVEVNVSQEN